MIYSKLFEASVEDAVQTPGDTGADLDQIEKNIMGDDGIESHRVDVEDAQDGVIGDPVDEFSMIVFESEYNYNQILQAIGMSELNETAMGRTVVYEAKTVKSFFEVIKDFLIGRFKQITEIVKNILAKMDLKYKIDKKFIDENKDKILKSSNNWSLKGYKIGKLDFASYYNNNSNYPNNIRTSLKELRDSMKDGSSDVGVNKKIINGLKTRLFTNPSNPAATCYNMFGIKNANDNTEFREALKEKIMGKDKVELNTTVNARDVITILSEEKEKTAIKNAYNDIKKDLKNNLNQIKEWQNALDSNSANLSYEIEVCELGTRMIKYQTDVVNLAYGIFIKAANIKRAQARKIAHMMAGSSENEDKNVKSESTSIFKNISLV